MKGILKLTEINNPYIGQRVFLGDNQWRVMSLASKDTHNQLGLEHDICGRQYPQQDDVKILTIENCILNEYQYSCVVNKNLLNKEVNYHFIYMDGKQFTLIEL